MVSGCSTEYRVLYSVRTDCTHPLTDMKTLRPRPAWLHSGGNYTGLPQKFDLSRVRLSLSSPTTLALLNPRLNVSGIFTRTDASLRHSCWVGSLQGSPEAPDL